MTTQEQSPEVIPWDRFQKEAERGVDVSVYIASMNAHILNQRDALAKLNKQRERLRAALREAREYILDNSINERTMAPIVERIDDALKLAVEHGDRE